MASASLDLRGTALWAVWLVPVAILVTARGTTVDYFLLMLLGSWVMLRPYDPLISKTSRFPRQVLLMARWRSLAIASPFIWLAAFEGAIVPLVVGRGGVTLVALWRIELLRSASLAP